MKRPLTGLAVLYASGIWVGSLVNWPVGAMLWTVSILLCLFLLVFRARLCLLALLALVFSLGILRYRDAISINSSHHIVRLLGLRDQNAVLRGIIVSDTGFRVEVADANDQDRLRFELEVNSVRRAGQWQPATGRILVFVSEARKQQPLRYGDALEFSAIVRVPPPVRNPGTFDWRSWLMRRNIHFTATIGKKEYCIVQAHKQGNPVVALSLRLREHFERALCVGLEDEPKLAGVLAGMVIGKRSEIPPATYADFQRTGVFHVFAISGLHVGLVTAIVVIGLQLLRVPRRWCGVVAIPLLILYVYATGARPGAVRALVMACVWLIGWMVMRPTDSLNNLATAALLILLWQPTQLFDGGFILSFAAVTTLVTLTPRIEARFRALINPDPFLPSQLVSRWRELIEIPAVWGARLLSASLSAWMGLLPLMALYFHLFTPISILANVLAIPMLGFIISLGLLSMMTEAVLPWLALTFNNANYFLLGTMIRGVEWLGSVPYGFQFVQEPPAWLAFVYYAMGALLLSGSLSWRRTQLAAAVAIPAVGVAALFLGAREDAVELTLLDLNDGVSIFLNAPGEKDDLLIDGGGDWSGRRVVLPFLRAQGVDRLAATVLTRGDKAHASGLSAVAAEIPVGQAIHSGAPSRSKYYSQWIEHMRTFGVALRELRAGDELASAPSLVVLHPPRGKNANRSEDNALVLAVEFGPTRVLLMSDAGETVEKQLLKDAAPLRSQVIVKGRHGSEPSCTPAFLDAVQPDVIVQAVSQRFGNRYMEPDLRERVEQRGVRLYRSDETGAVTIRLTSRGYSIRTHLD